MTFEKAVPVKSRATLERFAAEQDRCACCWIGRNPTLDRRLEIHHLVKLGRSDERCNLLMLCNECHRLAEGERIRVAGELLPTLTLGMCLWLKLESDPEHFDLARLTKLRHWNMPPLEMLPDRLLGRRHA